MVSIDYKKAYDMAHQSWIQHCFKMYKIHDEIEYFIEKTMQTWRVELTAGGQNSAEVKIQRGIFQGDALSPLLFVVATTLLNHILRKCTARHKLSKSQKKKKNDQLLDVQGRHQTFCLKRKRNGNPNTNCENIQSRYRDGIWL